MTPFGRMLEQLRRSRGLQQSQLTAETGGFNPAIFQLRRMVAKPTSIERIQQAYPDS